MVIQGNKLGEYVDSEMRRMGFESPEQMLLADQLWRKRFGTPLPYDYKHERDFKLLEFDLPKLQNGGLTFII